jgi:hypothetical protein
MLFTNSTKQEYVNIAALALYTTISNIHTGAQYEAWCTTERKGREGTGSEGKERRSRNVNKYNNTQLTEASGTTRL